MSKLLDLREFARGKPCLVRLPGCDGGGETTVLAHIRRGGVAGMGQKPPDLCGVHACYRCHAVIDAREYVVGLTRLEIDQAVLLALCRTLAEVSKVLNERS